MADTAIRFTARGKVQGVFFRKHAVAKATEQSQRGWVRNAPDGSVEGEAAGSATGVASFQAWLSRGSPRARVDSLSVVAFDAALVGEPGFGVRA